MLRTRQLTFSPSVFFFLGHSFAKVAGSLVKRPDLGERLSRAEARRLDRCPVLYPELQAWVESLAKGGS